MPKFFPSKQDALPVLKQDAKFFYVYGAVIALFALYLSVRELDASYFVFLIGAALFVGPAFFTVYLRSRIAAGLLLFFTFAQLVGALVSFGFFVNAFLNVLFGVVFFALGVRMFVTSIRLNQRDTIDA